MALGKTMKYYRSAAGKASYKKKLKKDVERSTSKKGLKKRAELKRLRNKLNAPKNKDVSHTKNGIRLSHRVKTEVVKQICQEIGEQEEKEGHSDYYTD